MFKGKASVKTMHRQCSGIARQQNRDRQKLNIIWVWRIKKVKEFVRTMHRQCIGIVRQQNKDWPMPI